jgi:hypothetical protein
MATVMNKRKVSSIEGKVKVIREIENGRKTADVSGIWSGKFYAPHDLEK